MPREAVAKCPKHRHLCTALELHTGGYQARGGTASSGGLRGMSI